VHNLKKIIIKIKVKSKKAVDIFLDNGLFILYIER
jgi:hypothetical protein